MSMSCQADTPFVAAVQSSPSMVDSEEAAKVTISNGHDALSQDEDEELMKNFEDHLKTKKMMKRYNRVHGFMSAR